MIKNFCVFMDKDVRSEDGNHYLLGLEYFKENGSDGPVHFFSVNFGLYSFVFAWEKK